jgi:hypothetical protein
MVDALRRAHRIVRPEGCVVDLHPTAALSLLEVGARCTGRVDAGDAPSRHAAAGAAISAAIDEGLFAAERGVDFTFYTYGDTIEELRDYIVENWRNARIDEETIDRTREALRDAPGTRPRVRECVRVTRLQPIA